ncbi:MAG: mechanosensitive ion channel family protein [Vulcanimicrobiota bacterium]
MEALQIVFDSVTNMGKAFLATLPKLLIALGVVCFTWLVVRLATRAMEKAMDKVKMRDSLQDLFKKLAGGLIWSIGLMLAGSVVFPELTPAKILTVLGLGSVAIGFAFKDVFENFLAGVLILLREPFRLGDFIEVDGYVGKVEEVTIRDTHVRQSDGQRVVLPNAMLFKNAVTVITDLPVRRTTITCGVGYGEDVAKARQVIMDAVQACDQVLDDRPVQIYAREFGSSSIDFEVTWWTQSPPGAIRKSRDQVVEKVKRALDAANIEIPFPYRTLTFAEGLELAKPREMVRN